MKYILSFIFAILIVGIIAGSNDLFHSTPPEPETSGQLSARIAEDYLIPRYRALASATAAQSEGWQQYCSDPKTDETGNADKATLIDRYHKVADRWAEIEHIRFGPVELYLRHDRFYHWPERRNAVSRALAALVKSPDKSPLSDPTLNDPARFARVSVAAQGLPALERLLFPSAISTTTPYDPGVICAVGQAIAANLASISAQTVDEWAMEGGVLDLINAGQSHPVFFTNNDEVARQLLTGLLTGFQMIRDIKLRPVMGDGIAKVRPKKAEAWRSNRSGKNIQRNIESLNAMAAAFSDRLPTETKSKISGEFEKLQAAAVFLTADNGTSIGDLAAEQDSRTTLDTLLAASRSTSDTISSSLPEQLGITIGFNALDGD